MSRLSRGRLQHLPVRVGTGASHVKSDLSFQKQKPRQVRGYGKLDQSNYLHTRDIRMGTGLFAELRKHFNWEVAHTGEHEAQIRGRG